MGQKGAAFQQDGIGVGNSCVWVLTSLWGRVQTLGSVGLPHGQVMPSHMGT